MKLLKLDANKFVVDNLPLYFFSTTLSERGLRGRAHKILNNIQNHLEVVKILKEKFSSGRHLTVEFKPHAELRSDAMWDSLKRTILIADHFSDESHLLDYFVFELCNANNSAFKRVSVESYETSERYAESLEIIEYNTHCKAVQLETLGVNYYRWSRRWLSRKKLCFEEYVEKMKESRLEHHGFSHFETYQRSFLKFRIDMLSNEILLHQNQFTGKVKLSEVDIKTTNETAFRLEEKRALYRAEKLALEETATLRLSTWEQKQEATYCLCLFSSNALKKRYRRWAKENKKEDEVLKIARLK